LLQHPVVLVDQAVVEEELGLGEVMGLVEVMVLGHRQLGPGRQGVSHTELTGNDPAGNSKLAPQATKATISRAGHRSALLKSMLSIIQGLPTAAFDVYGPAGSMQN
jgi:hypothetical protein